MKCNILLIDDNTDDQLLFKRILFKSEVDAKLVALTEASQGLEMLKQSTFDCIFLDYNLPQMNGIDFLKELKKCELQVPVIMLTGQEDEKIIIKLMQEGAIDYISKNQLNEDLLRISIQNARTVFELRMQKLQAEEALRISEARLAEAQTIALVGNWEYDFKTQKLFLSNEARRILDYPEGELSSSFNFLRHMHPDDVSLMLKLMKDKIPQNQQDITFRLYSRETNTEKYIHAKGYVVRNDHEEVLISRGTIQDITILKKAMRDKEKARIGRKATTIVFGIAILAFLISEALLDPFVDGLHTSLLIGLSFKGGLALFLKPIETFLEKFMLSRIVLS
ncbi:MAG TPA: response regulator [Cytophagaceae bacterium]|nr:response regulator [Cytophagaceae bacterium]